MEFILKLEPLTAVDYNIRDHCNGKGEFSVHSQI